MDNDLKGQTQKILSSLVISSAKALTVKRLRQDYLEMVGCDVPFREFGFPTFEQFLLSIPETCRVNGVGLHAVVIPVVTEKTKHINDMIVRQRTPRNKSGYRHIARPFAIYSSSPQTQQQQPRQVEPKAPVKLPVLNPDSHKRVLPPPSDYVKETTEKSTIDKFNNLHLSSDDEFDLIDDFHYNSDEEFQIRKQNSGATKQDFVESYKSRLDANIKEKLRVLISEHPDGIWCNKLLKLYQSRFNRSVDPADFGFASVFHMCSDIPDVLHCIRINQTDWKIYDKRKPLPDVNTLQQFSNFVQNLPVASTSNTLPALPEDFVKEIPKKSYPKDVLTPDDVIERQWLLYNEQPKDYIELMVSEVYDPSKFWIQLCGDKTTTALMDLMNDMQLFYARAAPSMILNKDLIRVGLYCAALFMHEYHRAVVMKIFDDDKIIRVYYIDYGTVGDVPIQKTYYLHRDFGALKQQAIRGRLSNIQPPQKDTMWSRGAAKFMLSLITEKKLFGYIYDIDRGQQILDLILTDTSNPDEDVHINDALILNGYAILGNQPQEPSDPNVTATVTDVHLYPDFQELESGEYPTVKDLVCLFRTGQTYENIYPGYFQRNTSMHTTSTSVLSMSISPVPSSLSLLSPDELCETKKPFETVKKSNEVSENLMSSLFPTLPPACIHDPAPPPPPPASTHNHVPFLPLPTPPVNNVQYPPPGFENFPRMFNSAVRPMPYQVPPCVPNDSFRFNWNSFNQFQFQFHQQQQHQMYMREQEFLRVHRQEMLRKQQQEFLRLQQQEFLRQRQEQQLFQQLAALRSNARNVPQQTELQTDNKSERNETKMKEELFVYELKIKDFIVHIIKIETDLYLASQELIEKLLSSKLMFKSWLQANDLTFATFPNKLINIMNFEQVYKQVQRYEIPGVYASSLGCNLRLTRLDDIELILQKYGNSNVLEEYRKKITELEM